MIIVEINGSILETAVIEISDWHSIMYFMSSVNHRIAHTLYVRFDYLYHLAVIDIPPEASSINTLGLNKMAPVLLMIFLNVFYCNESL